jgi:hypothetical protein
VKRKPAIGQVSFRGDAQHRTRNLALITSGFRVQPYRAAPE